GSLATKRTPSAPTPSPRRQRARIVSFSRGPTATRSSETRKSLPAPDIFAKRAGTPPTRLASREVRGVIAGSYPGSRGLRRQRVRALVAALVEGAHLVLGAGRRARVDEARLPQLVGHDAELAPRRPPVDAVAGEVAREHGVEEHAVAARLREDEDPF